MRAALVPERLSTKGRSCGVSRGLIICLTWERLGARTQACPIPLGLDVVSRRLREDTRTRVAAALEASIRHAMANEDAAVDYALPFGRGMERELCRQFVRMYVNEDTINMGEEGRRALETLYRRAYKRGLIKAIPELDIIGL